MKKEFKFFDQPYALEMDGSVEQEGELQLCRGVVTSSGGTSKGVFKLTKTAWEAANRKDQENLKLLVDTLVEGCVEAIKAELYIRPISDGFSYILDHRYFDKPPGWK